MKKLFFFVAILIGMAAQINAQTGIKITVYDELIAGTLSGGITPLCYGGSVGLISGTLPTGGEGSYTYQWQRSTDGGTTWTNIVGATALNYNPGAIYLSTSYHRIDTDPCGSVITNVISIIVYGQFVAGVVSGGNTPICYNTNGGTLTSTAPTGGAPGTTYQWQQSTDGEATWTNIVGATTLTYNIGMLTQTTSFRLGYINSCSTLYSNVTTIVVYGQFVAGVVSGGNTPICYNTNGGTLTSTAPTGGAPGTTYQWESSLDGVTYTNIVGATNLTLALGNLTQTMWYRLRYTNVCNTLYSNVINIVVYNQFVAGIISLVGTDHTCYNTDPGSFTGTAASGGAPGTTYQWQQSTNGGTTWTNIGGATTQNYDPGVLTVTTVFRRQDVNLCQTLYTNTITITVYAVFNPGTIGSIQSICYGEVPLQLGNIIAPSGGDGTYTYQWQESNDGGLTDPWANISGATNVNYQPTILFDTIWYRRIVTNVCGSAPSLP